MKDANATITLLEKWPEKISGSERSEPEIFSGHFSSSVMAAFASFILSFNCYCWTSITTYPIKLKRWWTVDAEFILFYKRSNHLCQYWIKKPEFPYEKIKRKIWSDRPASNGFLPPQRFRILSPWSPKNPDFGWTLQFPSVIVTSVIKIKQTLH